MGSSSLIARQKPAVAAVFLRGMSNADNVHKDDLLDQLSWVTLKG
jgi:hypothetical protein